LRQCMAEVGGDLDCLIPGHDPIVSARHPAETHLANGEPVALRIDQLPTKPLGI
jgi:hypothetical protein